VSYGAGRKAGLANAVARSATAPSEGNGQARLLLERSSDRPAHGDMSSA
jgi:hypothetical protein